MPFEQRRAVSAALAGTATVGIVAVLLGTQFGDSAAVFQGFGLGVAVVVLVLSAAILGWRTLRTASDSDETSG